MAKMMIGVASKRRQAANSHSQFFQNREAEFRLGVSEVRGVVEDSVSSQISWLSDWQRVGDVDAFSEGRPA